LNSVDLIFDFVTFSGEQKKTKAMNGTCGRTQFRDVKADFIPGKVREIEKQEAGKERKQDSARGK
jgi:hypothetical protein